MAIGKYMPKEDSKEDKKGAKKKKAAKKDPKGKEAPKVYKWMDAPGRKVEAPVMLDHMKNARKDLSENLFPMNLRGD